MNKPIDATRRAEIKEYCEAFGAHGSMIYNYLQQYIAAEAFWREVVKQNIAEFNEMGYCELCGGEKPTWSAKKLVHKPDCPWLLAQE